MPIFMASGLKIPMNELSGFAIRDVCKEEKIKTAPLRNKEIKTHSRRIGKPEKVPRHSQKDRKIFDKIRIQFVAIHVKR